MAGQPRRYIRFEGDLATEYEEKVISQAALGDLLPLLEHRIPIYSPILPIGTRAEYWDSSNPAAQIFCLLIEREPMIANINYRGTVHKVSLPWTRFYVRATTTDPNRNARWNLADIRSFWSKVKFEGKVDDLDMIQALVPNIYENGAICFGTTGVETNQTLATRLDQIINNFYITDFTNHFTTQFPNNWRGFPEWVKMTKDEPLAWQQWPDWEPASRHQKFSWNSLTSGVTMDRTERVFTDQGIPPLDPGATWMATNEWALTLSNNNRARLRDVIAQMPAEMFTVTRD